MAQAAPDGESMLRDEAEASRRRPWPVAMLAIIALALIVFAALAAQIHHGPLSLDRSIILAMRDAADPASPRGPAWLPLMARDVTALGSTAVLTLVVALAATALALADRWRTAVLVAGATAGGAWVNTLLKVLFARPRPDIVQHLMEETSNSFPSGHAANSAIVYLTLSTLLFPLVRGRRLRGFVIAAMLVLVGLIGVSRVYLGVHWPSDVLAGWTFGSLWALLWWRIELALFARSPRPALR